MDTYRLVTNHKRERVNDDERRWTEDQKTAKKRKTAHLKEKKNEAKFAAKAEIQRKTDEAKFAAQAVAQVKINEAKATYKEEIKNIDAAIEKEKLQKEAEFQAIRAELDLDTKFIDSPMSKSIAIIPCNHLPEGDQFCSICREKLTIFYETACIPGCFHSYHLNCIKQWLVDHTDCPMCKTELQPGWAPRIELQNYKNHAAALTAELAALKAKVANPNSPSSLNMESTNLMDD
jgi:hypothetical protein